MRALPRLRSAVPVFLCLLFVSLSSLGCSEAKKPGPAPIIDGRTGATSSAAVVPPSRQDPYVRPSPPKPRIDQDPDSFFTKYFGYGWAHDLWNPQKGLIGHPSPLWVLISLMFGLLCGAFFSDRLRWLRRWVFLIIGLLIVAWILFDGAPVAYAGWFLLGFGVAWFLLRIIFKASSNKGTKPTTFGSAEWADLDHLRERNLIGSGGYLLGYFADTAGKSHPIHYTGDRHLLTVAPTRAGKGVSAIVPNLLTYTGSALVIDPKGENARITSKARTAMGQTVHVVDPWGITGLAVSTFNPFD